MKTSWRPSGAITGRRSRPEDGNNRSHLTRLPRRARPGGCRSSCALPRTPAPTARRRDRRLDAVVDAQVLQPRRLAKSSRNSRRFAATPALQNDAATVRHPVPAADIGMQAGQALRRCRRWPGCARGRPPARCARTRSSARRANSAARNPRPAASRRSPAAAMRRWPGPAGAGQLPPVGVPRLPNTRPRPSWVQSKVGGLRGSQSPTVRSVPPLAGTSSTLQSVAGTTRRKAISASVRRPGRGAVVGLAFGMASAAAAGWDRWSAP